NSSYLQKGVREPLLCIDCEEKFSRHEKYVAEVFSGKREVFLSRAGGLVIAEGIDYTKFKLFALSVLWRAGVSRNNFFRDVELGPHQEKLRYMLLNDHPGESSEYPFILTL